MSEPDIIGRHQPDPPTEPAAERWTPERVELMLQLRADGKSASETAEILGNGFTRNSVIGKWHRLKLPRLAKSSRSNLPRPPRDRKPKLKPRAMPVVVPMAPEPPSDGYIPPRDAWEPLPGMTPVALVDLTAFSCRWPIGGTARSSGTGFCGCAAVEGKTYCPVHLRMSIGKGTKSEREIVRKAMKVAA